MSSHRKGEVFLWLTMQPETSQLTPRTVADLLSVTTAIKKHAILDWGCTESVASCIAINKIDFTLDLEGSFIPEEGSNCR